MDYSDTMDEAFEAIAKAADDEVEEILAKDHIRRMQKRMDREALADRRRRT